MTKKHSHKPSISASSLGQVRKIYMSKMTEQGCSRTLKDKCRDIWDKVIDDAVEADAECSGMGLFSYGYGKELEPLYIPDKGNGIQKKENGKQAHTEGSTESETESEEESNSETEVEIDPSLDGSESRGLDQVNTTLEALDVEEREASQGENKVVKKESEQNRHQHHAAKSPVTKSPKHRLSPPAKVKVQESDGDADSEREVGAEKEDFNTLFGYDIDLV
ncbi:hypothetical protein BO83DRAFT_433415 [Aspergillus eucalypticola CBS 122712]|uniref:Uncharacterized protein n=1 Tax=Aspergillus eucalypticola (strain CBS 122712 / IBT 29274) TaxID=1448314 RepID=A0A317WGN0_ASPEC|nr:uncharacterized protein BO83DRAFT_433415 [Aspergillus eucalypticola CBS 122712]PWY85479.1 hypothetical protein BO83DRAFT_433415 [Aspergillus eucalypticola CBS 122712]